MQLGPDKIAEIRERVDIVALIGDVVPLKRVGSQFRGLCPFHSEKSPSFYVHPGRQMFKCFGCQVAGDVISFVMRSEGRTFPEAIRILAERAGVELPVQDEREESAQRQARQKRERLLAITDATAGFFLKMLAEHPLGKMAQAEIDKRGMTEATRTTYRLGYAPAGWDGLTKFLAQKGYTGREAEEAGVLVPNRRGDGHYDRFRHRLMFPIADVHGHIVAFSGRVLPTPPGEPEPTEQMGKYVNSPEGPLYHKGELLFGIHEARVPLRQQGVGILCEGNFDVLAIHQAGLPNVVAPLGTAFTLAQAKLLRRYVQRVVLVFDGDNAGKKAIAAAFPLLSEAGLGATVAPLPRGEDPDSLLRAKGPEGLKRLIELAVPAAQHLIEAAAEQAGTDPAAKSVAIEGLGSVLAAVDNPVERELYLERIAQAFGVSNLRSIQDQLRKGQRSQPKARRAEPEPPQESVPSAPSATRETTPAPALEKDLVGAYLDAPELFRTKPIENVLSLLTSADLRAILRRSAEAAETSGSGFGPHLMDLAASDPNVSPRAKRWLEERLVIQNFDAASAESFHRSAVILLEKQAIERQQQQLAKAVQVALREGDSERAEELMRHRTELFQKAKKLGQAQ